MIKPFKIKFKRVQDYPDPSKTITIYGESDKSKFKLNDKVVLINFDARYYKQTVIGFDEHGLPYIDKCSWSCTRAGYNDNDLILYDEFTEIYKSLSTKQILYINDKFNKQIGNLYLHNSKESLKKSIFVKHWNIIINL